MRNITVKVKTAKTRSNSSARWLNRQLNDEYVILSKAEGYRSRAAYKLLEIHNKFKLIKPNAKILDLGSAPGGWSQIAAKNIGKKGKIVAVDLLDMAEIPGVDFIKGDFYDIEVIEKIKELLQGKPDLILSDMAPNTTGHKYTDHLKIMDLCERVTDFALNNLNENGAIILKIFQGGAQNELLLTLKKNFEIAKHYKPNSSRKSSSEIYLIAKNFKKTSNE